MAVDPDSIETFLQWLEGFYTELPTVAREIDSWDMAKRWDYTDDEIPSIKTIMRRLREWEPDMSVEDRARLERLKELEAKCAPLIDKVLGF